MRTIFVELLVIAVMAAIIFLLPEDILTRLMVAYCVATLIYYIADKGWEKK
jgi:hypothetical protein